MVNLAGMFPESWRTTVDVQRGGGRNADGDYVKPTSTPMTDVLVAPRATAEPEDRSNKTTTTGVLYAGSETTWFSSDVVVISKPHPMAGRWGVDGDVSAWPLGVEVPLRRL